MNLNLNNAECITKAYGITGKTFYNICDGGNVFVPYGFGDYVQFMVVTAMLFIMVATLSSVVGKIRSVK